MRRLALALLAGTSLLGLASVASAADLAIRKAPPPPPPPPIWSWSGFYIGAHVGGAWSTVESHLVDIGIDQVVIPIGIPLSSHNLNGFLGGVQAGFNWQVGVFVLGMEAQWSWTDQGGTAPCLIVFSCSTDTDWIGTFAGRIGVTVDRALLYLKGGFAWSENTYSADLSILGVNILIHFAQRHAHRRDVRSRHRVCLHSELVGEDRVQLHRLRCRRVRFPDCVQSCTRNWQPPLRRAWMSIRGST